MLNVCLTVGIPAEHEKGVASFLRETVFHEIEESWFKLFLFPYQKACRKFAPWKFGVSSEILQITQTCTCKNDIPRLLLQQYHNIEGIFTYKA